MRKYRLLCESSKCAYYEGFYAKDDSDAKNIARAIAKEKGLRLIEVVPDGKGRKENDNAIDRT